MEVHLWCLGTIGRDNNIFFIAFYFRQNMLCYKFVYETLMFLFIIKVAYSLVTCFVAVCRLVWSFSIFILRFFNPVNVVNVNYLLCYCYTVYFIV